MKVLRAILLLKLIGLVACREAPPIYGTVKMDTEGRYAPKVYLIDPITFDGIAASYMGKLLDSAVVISDGSFIFEKMPDAAAPILLQIAVQKKGTPYLTQLEHEDMDAANYFPIVWKNGEYLKISAEANRFQNSFSIEDPSPENAAMLHLRDLRREAFKTFIAGKALNTPAEADLLEIEKARSNFQQPLMQFAEESPHLLPSLTAIRWLSIEGNYERIPEFIFQQCQKWQQENPTHSWVAQLCEHGSREVLPVLKGDILPNFSLPMRSGDTIALQQLLAKRLTLLDLWASWCAPCRQENRNYLVPLWGKYHQEDFQIIGYALDASRKVWEGAIEKDGAYRWLHASHLQGDDSPFFQALRINTIPANFLLDGEGRVIAKNLHGEELVKFVATFMEN